MGKLFAMILMIIVLLLGIISCTSITPSITPNISQSNLIQEITVDQLIQAYVIDVIDGDTIEVDISGRLYKVRYIGVDTPERGQFGYEEALLVNEQLVSNGIIWLERDISETDRYGRLLRYVWTEEDQVNAQLIASGYAKAVTYPPDIKYQDIFLELQRQAREAGLGLWANNDQLKKNQDIYYVGSIKSNIYHYPSCWRAIQIYSENLITFSSTAKARARGYVPCKVCKPQ